MFDVGAFCCNPVLVRKGWHGKTPAYDALVTETQPCFARIACVWLLSIPFATAHGSVVALAPVAPPTGALREAQAASLRIAGSALGAELEIEVRDLSRSAGEKALNAAWDAVQRAGRELDSRAATPARAAKGTAPLSEDLFNLMLRASSFCTWSDGASGPLGGAVYRLWAESVVTGALPIPDELEAAAATTKCNRVTLNAATRTIEISPGSELDLRGFARGWAVDLAVRALRDAGAANAKVALGPVTRGMGAGPDGKGWPVPLPTLSASGNPASHVFLVDEALAVSNPSAETMRVGGEQILPAFDLRTGRPARGVSSVVTVTALAADAEPLAMAMSVLGANGGQLRLGSLRPRPSVLWLLGSGETAVVASSNWSAVHKP